MNLFDSAFLCLDIGTAGVRGVAQRIRAGRIDRAAIFCVDDVDTVFAIKAVVDTLEKQIGRRLDHAYVTGNLGPAVFDVVAKSMQWRAAHRIGAADVRAQIRGIDAPDGFYPMHIVPLRYDTPSARNIATPVGHIDHQLISAFGAIFYSRARLDAVLSVMRRAHIQPDAFYDPMFLINAVYRTPGITTMFIDIGAEFTSVSIWTDRGPVLYEKISGAMTDVIARVAKKLNIGFDDALRVVHGAADLVPREMDRFTPADTAFEFSRADVGDIVRAGVVDIAERMTVAAHDGVVRFRPRQIFITGGGANIAGIGNFVENAFGIPTRVLGADAPARACAQYIWAMQMPRRRRFFMRRRHLQKILRRITSPFRRRNAPRRRACFVPVMPSTLCFDMRRDATYSMFRAGGISAIHVDIMDGLYVSRMAGSIDELGHIRKNWPGHLHVHLMTESPAAWAADAVAHGADTVIVSPNTSGVRAAVAAVRAAGKRAGVALNPETPVSALRSIIRDLDEVMVMTVAPGAAGQEFNTECVKKIKILAATRKKYGLKFKISVDGGIDDKTAPIVWAAGADMVVSGSYLARATDFPIAVQQILPHTTK